MIAIASNEKRKDEHDVSYKALFSKKENFLHFLRKYIGATWVDDIDNSDLILMDKSFILKDYKDKESDIIYRAKLKGKEVIFYILTELQSSVDYTMSFRLLLYMTELLRREFENADKKRRETKDYRLPAVVPIVLYNGFDKWTAVRQFKEYMDSYELFGENIINFEYLLWDLNRGSEEFILNTNRILDNIFALDQKNSAKDMSRILNILIRRYGQMERFEQIELMRWLKHILIQRIPEESDRLKILESVERGEEISMQYGWDRAFENERQEGKKIGEEIGKAIGKEIGVKIGMKKIICNMLDNGKTLKEIIRDTGLTSEELEKLLKNKDI